MTIEFGALAVLHHLLQIACQQVHQLRRLLLVLRRRAKPVLQLVDQLDGQGREVVDEVQRVLDLVGNARGQLAE